jgi:hypothetical protein
MPNDAGFQTRVLRHALRLLEVKNGPVLEDFPEDAPDMKSKKDQVQQMACPVNFNIKKEPLSSTERLLESFSLEFFQMKTWYDLALSKNNRTTTGVSGFSPEESLAFISAFVKGDEPNKDIPSLADSLRMVAEDIKAFYLEGLAAQPGQPTDSSSLADWFWGETYAALVINEVRKISLTQDSDMMKLLGKLLLVPRNQMHRFNM